MIKINGQRDQLKHFFFFLGTMKTGGRVNDTVNKAKCACVYIIYEKSIQIK